MNLVTHVYCSTKVDLCDQWLEPEPNDSVSLEKYDRKARERVKVFIASSCDVNKSVHRRFSIVLEARDELNGRFLCVGGGTVRDELYRSELDSQFCKNYESWLRETLPSPDAELEMFDFLQELF